MAFQTITMNLTGLQNVTSPNITIDTTDVFDGIVSGAESSTEGYLIFASLFIIGVILYFVLTDDTKFQDFGYDYMRGLAISLGTCAIMGINMVEVGWSSNFYAVGFFTTLWFLSMIGVLIIENKQ